ncbi:hydroxymethylbilane synthase [bacterium]|nr:hydroxymethylbilane synthase [bacterium]
MMPLRLGTRSSALAMAQADMVSHAIQVRGGEVTLCPMTTEGDRSMGSLQAMGGKGVFIRDIERALLSHEVDMAIHSLKDVTATMADGTVLAGFLGGESCRDCLVSHAGWDLSTLPSGATVGSSSLRRAALCHYYRPDIQVVPIRGNVQTRLASLDTLDAVMLSEVGLLRLGITQWPVVPLSPLDFIPAPGQGVIAIQVRDDDERARTMAAAISDPLTQCHASAHTHFLRGAHFDCQVPLGMHSWLVGQRFLATLFRATATYQQMAFAQFECGMEERDQVAWEWGQRWHHTPL